MKELFHQRLNRHQKQMMRYLRYVFNDHFVLACTFLLGGVGLYYSNLVKQLPSDFLPGKLLVIAVLVLVLHLGNFVSLTKPADVVFLLPKEKEMRSYLEGGFRYSLLLPFVSLVLLGGFMMPLYVVSAAGQFSDFFPLVLGLWGLKVAHLLLKRYRLFQNSQDANKWYGFWLVFSVLALALAVFVNPWVVLPAGIGIAVVYYQLLWKNVQQPLDWNKMIQLESNRLQRIYRFINLFTDVPQVAASVKRRKYLDGLLTKIPKDQGHTYLYLYARRMLRGSEFSGLYLRLVVIGGLLLYFVNEIWFSVGLGALFLYLIGFQLVPLYNQFQYMVMTQLYPVPSQQKTKALRQLLLVLLLVAAVIFTVVGSIPYPSWGNRGLLLAVFVAVALAFTYLYLPLRIKKMAD